MDERIMEIITAGYEKQRSENKRRRDERVRQVYAALPEVETIDRDIARIGSETLKRILADPRSGAKDEMRKKFAILKQRKNELLIKNGIETDFNALKYRCPLCEDTGYIENKGRCSCFDQKFIDILYEQSNMKELLKKQNFALFEAGFYSKKPVPGFKKTPYENILNIKEYCIHFIENFDSTSKNLLFYGDTGLGKTFMSSCIAKELIEKNKTVIYVRASRLFRKLEDDRFGRLEEGMDSLYNSDLVIIDDLGTELQSKNNAPFLLDLINERIDSGRKVIINTNLNFEGLEKLYTKRFSSRILESFSMLFFYGNDIRKQKLLGNK